MVMGGNGNNKQNINNGSRKVSIIADEFVCLCSEYGIAPELVAEDMLAAGLKSVSVKDVRKFIEENY